jgi:hypothetical protein
MFIIRGCLKQEKEKDFSNTRGQFFSFSQVPKAEHGMAVKHSYVFKNVAETPPTTELGGTSLETRAPAAATKFSSEAKSADLDKLNGYPKGNKNK